MPPLPLFDKSGGYRKMHSFHFATLVQLGTISFCRRFIPWKDDPLGKTAGQMIGAARSGRQNIIEGSERSSTSKETEMKLLDVARASLGELLGDLEIHLAVNDRTPWGVQDKDHKAPSALNFPEFNYTDDTLRDFWLWFHREKNPFMPWLDSNDEFAVANALIILTRRAMAMLGGQLRQLGETFAETGGFRERLTQTRLAARESPATETPVCPTCGAAMRLRTARKGSNAGKTFWSCAQFPDCKGTLPHKT